MNPKLTVALLAAALLAGWWALSSSEDRPASDERLVLPRAAGKPVPLERLVIDGVEGHTELLRGPNGRWQVTSPVADRADARVLGELVGMLEGMPKFETLPATPERLAATGLNEPRARIGITRRGEAERILLLGNTAPVEGRIYARLAGGEVIVIPKALRDLVLRKPDGFREARLTDTLASDIVSFSIRNSRGTLKLSRESGKWEILGPDGGRASAKIVDEWLEKLLGYGIRHFAGSDLGDLFRFGLAAPRAAVRLDIESKTGREIPPIEWFLGDRADARYAAGAVYVRIPARHAVVAVPLDAEELLFAAPETFRERTLTALNLDFIDRVRLEQRGSPALLLGRRGEGWELRQPAKFPAESGEMQNLVRALNRAEVLDFVRDEAEIARIFAEPPELRLVFSAYASETTAESAAGETPAVTLEFSGPQPNGLRVVRNVEEKLVVRVSESLVAGLALQPAQWQRLVLTDRSSGELLSFEARPAAGEPRGYQFRPEGGWARVSGPEKFEAGRVQSVAALLGRLRAVRWSSGDVAETGLSAPSLTVTARFAGREEAFTLQIGGRTPDGMWFAQLTGHDGVAVLSDPDVQIFLSLLADRK